jgi:hypothetical protein
MQPGRALPPRQAKQDAAQQPQQREPLRQTALQDMVAAMRFVRVFRPPVGVVPRRGAHQIQVNDM